MGTQHVILVRAASKSGQWKAFRGTIGFHKKAFIGGCSSGRCNSAAEGKIVEPRTVQCDPHSPFRLKRFGPAAEKPGCPARAVEPQTIGHNVETKEHGNWLGESVVKKLAEREARRMQTERQSAARNEDAANFRQRFLNVHVGEGNGGNDAIETLCVEWQTLTGAMLISVLGESQAGGGQPRFVDINSRNFVGSDDAPCSQIESRTAT